MIDIYFEHNYGKLYEEIEKGTCEVFEHNCLFGSVRHMFIKREIPYLVNGKKYFDITTPYGYGGPLIKSRSEQNKEKLVNEFKLAFEGYCRQNNIVSEFVRFHPVVGNAKDFTGCYDVIYDRKTVGTNLTAYDKPFEVEFSKSCRKNIRKALNEGVQYKITHNPDSLDQFKKVYYSTMDRNNATDYYYFNDEYFRQCLQLLGKNIVFVEAIYKEQTIAMGLYFIYNKIIHVHLSGTLSEFLYLSPAYILRYAITIWGKENGYELIHHGGGRTDSIEDSLYLFKKQFGNNTEFKFCIGKKIWDRDIYSEICEFVGANSNIEFFPAYRA